MALQTLPNPHRESAKRSVSAKELFGQYVKNGKTMGFSEDEMHHAAFEASQTNEQKKQPELEKKSVNQKTKKKSKFPLTFVEVVLVLCIISILIAAMIRAFKKYNRQMKASQSKVQPMPEKIPVNTSLHNAWVVLQNLKPIKIKPNYYGIAKLSPGTHCKIDYGFIEKLDKYSKRVLVRFTCKGECDNTSQYCPGGAIFFIPKNEFESAKKEYHKKKAEKNFVRKAIKKYNNPESRYRWHQTKIKKANPIE